MQKHALELIFEVYKDTIIFYFIPSTVGEHRFCARQTKASEMRFQLQWDGSRKVLFKLATYLNNILRQAWFLNSRGQLKSLVPSAVGLMIETTVIRKQNQINKKQTDLQEDEGNLVPQRYGDASRHYRRVLRYFEYKLLKRKYLQKNGKEKLRLLKYY